MRSTLAPQLDSGYEHRTGLRQKKPDSQHREIPELQWLPVHNKRQQPKFLFTPMLQAEQTLVAILSKLINGIRRGTCDEKPQDTGTYGNGSREGDITHIAHSLGRAE
jgi:hypothetical protein